MTEDQLNCDLRGTSENCSVCLTPVMAFASKHQQGSAKKAYGFHLSSSSARMSCLSFTLCCRCQFPKNFLIGSQIRSSVEESEPLVKLQSTTALLVARMMLKAYQARWLLWHYCLLPHKVQYHPTCFHLIHLFLISS